MEFNEECLYENIKELPVVGGFNISDHRKILAVIQVIAARGTGKEILTIDDVEEFVNDKSASVGWDANSIMTYKSMINSHVLKFKDYFKFKHEYRGFNMKKFGL